MFREIDKTLSRNIKTSTHACVQKCSHVHQDGKERSSTNILCYTTNITEINKILQWKMQKTSLQFALSNIICILNKLNIHTSNKLSYF